MAAPNLSEIVSSTLRNRSGEFADNVTKDLALLRRLEQRGNVKPADGGRTLVQELEYAENSTFQYYSGYEVLNVAPSETFSAAEFNWKQAAVNVTWSGLEADIQNAGREKVIDLLESRIANARRTMANNLSTGIFSDGTGTSGKQVGGLQSLVADAPATGTVGGINRANYSFWRNQVYDFSDESVTPSATTIQAAMRNLYLNCKRGSAASEAPDFVVAGTTYFEYFWNSLTTIQRVTSDDEATAGFDSLKFRKADVFHDEDCAAARMYMLNTQYLFWRPHRNRNMVPLERKGAVNQDATVVPIVWAGNLTMSNAARQGVIVA
jgi:hypothetical protein|tara:strand:+ start:3862 stop:4827 length:966 start_codon:yes stop_codon:yes gene_type:complete